MGDSTTIEHEQPSISTQTGSTTDKQKDTGNKSTTHQATGRPTAAGAAAAGAAGITILTGQEGEKPAPVASGLNHPNKPMASRLKVPSVGKPPKEPKASTPKKSRASTPKKTDIQISADMVGGILKTGTGLMAMRLGAHWAFSDQECKAIADPAAELLERYDLAALLGKYGDWAALVAAITAATLPRMMVTVMNTPKKAKGAKNNVQPIRSERPTTTGNTNPGTGNQPSPNDHSGVTDHGSDSTKQLLAGLVG